MSYNEVSKKATIKYIKAKQRQLTIRFQKDEYETEIEPAIKASGLPVTTFIKEAVREKVERVRCIMT